ncbi:hypothetical protein [Azospirillum doebereinerae]
MRAWKQARERERRSSEFSGTHAPSSDMKAVERLGHWCGDQNRTLTSFSYRVYDFRGASTAFRRPASSPCDASASAACRPASGVQRFFSAGAVVPEHRDCPRQGFRSLGRSR